MYALRDAFGFPGIKILQFAFGDDPQAPSSCRTTTRARAVVYTGTHDNDTTAGWFHDRGGGWSTRTPDSGRASASGAPLPRARDGDAEIHWDMIRAAHRVGGQRRRSSRLQDLLGLGSEARMNRPGTAERQLGVAASTPARSTPAVADRLRDLTALYGRAGRA